MAWPWGARTESEGPGPLAATRGDDGATASVSDGPSTSSEDRRGSARDASEKGFRIVTDEAAYPHEESPSGQTSPKRANQKLLRTMTHVVKDLFHSVQQDYDSQSIRGSILNSVPSLENVLSPELEGDSLSFVGNALDTSPVENESFRQHTRFFGLFFKTLKMESHYLDGHARLHKNVVYPGYFLLVFAAIITGIGQHFEELYRRKTCPEEYKQKCGMYDSALSKYLITVTFKFTVTRTIPFFLVFAILGCSFNFLIHRLPRIKNKAWAILVTFSLYWFGLLSSNILTVVVLEYGWPDVIIRLFFLAFSVYIFFSGTPTFTLLFILWLQCMLVFIISYPISYAKVSKKYGETSIELLTLKEDFCLAFFWTLVITLLYLMGGFRAEISSRKEFLRRILIADQQEEIIRETMKHNKLQKRLLNNMLPSFVVDQLQQQDFTIQSWSQFRNLSHQHSGVCIMFAELDGFTAFSAQVEPSLVMEYLNDLFLIFDGLCDDYDVYKVETVGDQYVAAVGVVTGHMHNEHVGHQEEDCPSHSISSSEEAQSLSSVTSASTFNTKQMLGFAKAIIGGSIWVTVPEGANVCPRLRVGIHTGTCMSGIVGTRNFRFCLFGDTMNTAARMGQKSIPQHIQTTQDVVDLVPDECWEKLQKIEVKGKGLMQTYLLKMDDNLRHPSRKYRAYISMQEDFENPLFEMDERQNSQQLYLSASLGSLHGSSADSSRDQKYQPLSTKVFKEHTLWFGLFFKKRHVELAFLDDQARLNKPLVYFGYFLYVMVLLTNLLFGFVFFTVNRQICRQPAMEEFCKITFPDVFVDELSYTAVINNSIFRMTPGTGGVLLAFLIFGCTAHWFIHRSSFFKQKSWALLAVFIVYICNMCVISTAIMYFSRLPDETRTQWSWSLGPMMLIMGTLFCFFSGATFKFNLLFWLIAAVLYYGFTVPIILKDQAIMQEEMIFTPIVTTVTWIKMSVLLLWYKIVFVIGSYLCDITNRKRFLQRILMIKQQDQIIIEKRKNERMQREFLKSILPSNLVDELQRQQRTNASFKMRSLCHRHMGVSMLYADLVGFTAFCNQVDPLTVMVFLNELFQVFDGLCDDFNMHKIETVGDCYVAAVGVVTGELILCSVEESKADEAMGSFEHTKTRVSEKTTRNARDLIGFAKAMIRGSRLVVKPDVNTPATLRIGVHTVSPYSHFLFFASGEGNPLTFASLLRIHTGLLHQRCHWHKEPEVLLAWR